MFKKVLLFMIIIFNLLHFGCDKKNIVSSNDTVHPEVINTNPKNGEKDIDPALTEISVTFNEPMTDNSWSWCFEEKDKFPQMTDQPHFIENNTQNILPVKLEPDKEYIIWINTKNFKNFKDKSGNPAKPYKLIFKTKKAK